MSENPADRLIDHRRKPGDKKLNANHSGKLTSRADIRPAMLLNRESLSNGILDLLTTPEPELMRIVGDPTLPMVTKIVANVILESFRKKDPTRISFLFDRALGKVPNEQIERAVKSKIDLSKLSERQLLDLRKMVEQSGNPVTVEAEVVDSKTDLAASDKE